MEKRARGEEGGKGEGELRRSEDGAELVAKIVQCPDLWSKLLPFLQRETLELLAAESRGTLVRKTGPIVIEEDIQLQGEHGLSFMRHMIDLGTAESIGASANTIRMVLSMDIQDQGWGNNKGRITLVAREPESCFHPETTAFGTVISKDWHEKKPLNAPPGLLAIHSTAPCPRERARFHFEFTPRDFAAATQFFVVGLTGGGGGHRARLRNVSTEAFDSVPSQRRPAQPPGPHPQAC